MIEYKIGNDIIPIDGIYYNGENIKEVTDFLDGKMSVCALSSGESPKLMLMYRNEDDEPVELWCSVYDYIVKSYDKDNNLCFKIYDKSTLDEFVRLILYNSKSKKSISKYRSKPIEVEAIQITVDNFEELEKFAKNHLEYQVIASTYGTEPARIQDLSICTAEGRIMIRPNDYIYIDNYGIYHCISDVEFKERFEKVDE